MPPNEYNTNLTDMNHIMVIFTSCRSRGELSLKVVPPPSNTDACSTLTVVANVAMPNSQIHRVRLEGRRCCDSAPSRNATMAVMMICFATAPAKVFAW